MTTFWVIAAVLAVGALAFVLPPLLGRRRGSASPARDVTNVAIYRDQLRELEVDLAAGTLGREQYEEAKREIESRLLDDVRVVDAAPSAARSRRGTAIAVGVALPLSAVLLYFAVGNPGALAPERGGDSHGVALQQVENMVERLAARMKETPDDVKGWVMLGRSYAVLDRFPEAVAAYANAVKRSPPDAQLLADYADALAMSQGRRLLGEPERLIAQALKADPDNVKALALAGTVAFEKKDFGGAIGHWERILKVVPADSDMANSIRDSIADARMLTGGAAKTPPVPGPAAALLRAGVSGTVRLAPALASRTAPTDTVFIFARPADGPRTPLAVTRRQVRDLPAAFKLDDTMAMAQGPKLSEHARIVIGARVSRSGNPAAQPGDLEGLTTPVANDSAGVVVEIGTQIR